MQGTLNFDGLTYTPANDAKRLSTLLGLVYGVMRDGQWRTVAEIRQAIGRGSEAGISARLRDFRKPAFARIYPNKGVERRHRGEPRNGLFEYRMIPS